MLSTMSSFRLDDGVYVWPDGAVDIDTELFARRARFATSAPGASSSSGCSRD